jgi:hypothetical protein
MKTRNELLTAVASARTLAQSYLLGKGRFAHAQITTALGMLDDIEARIRSAQAPAADVFTDVRLGLYAVRNLDEVDEGRLSLALCALDDALKDR